MPIPGLAVLIQLASLVVHAEEVIRPGAHYLDEAAIQGILQNPDVQAWLKDVPAVLLPQKR